MQSNQQKSCPTGGARGVQEEPLSVQLQSDEITAESRVTTHPPVPPSGRREAAWWKVQTSLARCYGARFLRDRTVSRSSSKTAVGSSGRALKLQIFTWGEKMSKSDVPENDKVLFTLQVVAGKQWNQLGRALAVFGQVCRVPGSKLQTALGERTSFSQGSPPGRALLFLPLHTHTHTHTHTRALLKGPVWGWLSSFAYGCEFPAVL